MNKIMSACDTCYGDKKNHRPGGEGFHFGLGGFRTPLWGGGI